MVDDMRAVGDIEGITNIVIGDQHSDPLLCEQGDDGFDLVDRNGVYTGKGLIKQEELGADRQVPCDLRSSALTP